MQGGVHQCVSKITLVQIALRFFFNCRKIINNFKVLVIIDIFEYDFLKLDNNFDRIQRL